MTTVSKTPVLHEEISAGSYSIVLGIENVASAVMSTVAVWNRRYKGRRELSQLNDHMLADIGLTRVEAIAEIDKPFWRA